MMRCGSKWLRFAAVGSLLVLGYFYISLPEGDHPVRVPTSHQTGAKSCPDTPRSVRVVVSVKTGASEAADKLPAQMQSTLRCAKNVLFFSDLEQDVGEYHVHDSLDAVLPSVAEKNPDFDFYHQQSEMWKSTGNISSLKGYKNPEKPDEVAAWTLDKYKNLHIVEKTWALKPDMDWYVFIDADSYLFWSNLLSWLATMNPNKKSYFGSEVNLSGTRFAHGGSGIVISRAAMHQLVVEHNGTAAKWDPKIKDHCCGDLVLGMALKEHGTELQDVWPLFSGEAPSTLPFGPGTPEYVCRPALTMHHLSPTEMIELSEFEQQRFENPKPLTHIELFIGHTLKSIVPLRENWDNLAKDPGEFGKTGGVSSRTETAEECAQLCQDDEKCFQWSYNWSCYLGMSTRLGAKKDADEKGSWTSGWNQTRLVGYIKEQKPCRQVTFPKQDS